MNPEQMTKSQLKDALMANNIDLPPANAPKSAYLKLYQDHSETNVSSKSFRNKSHKSQSEIVEVVQFLSNSQVASKLRSLGHNIGPVNASTRKVYLKMLAGLIVSGDCSLEEDSALIQINIRHSDEPSIKKRKSKKDLETPTKDSRSEKLFSENLNSTPAAVSSATPRRPLRSFLLSSKPSGPIPFTDTADEKIQKFHHCTSWKTLFVATLFLLCAYLIFKYQDISIIYPKLN